MPGAEHRHLVPQFATPCAVLCLPTSPWSSAVVCPLRCW